ncbi:MAG: lysophospholipid acyltransferase family protein [Rikenellaceae bacterium]
MVLLCTLFLILSAVALVVCYPFDPARRVVHSLSKFMVHVFFGIPPYWRCRVEGAEYIEKGKSYVMVMNHNAMMDIPIPYLLPLNFRWVSKEEVFQIPFFGQFLVLHGDIVIQRGNGAEAMARVLKEGKQWISRGASVAIFPEGTRSRSGEIGRFKAGAFNLAREAGVDILPIVIDGTRDIIRKGGAFNWHSNMTLKVLPPIKYEATDYSEGRVIMDKLNQDMKDALQTIREAKQK